MKKAPGRYELTDRQRIFAADKLMDTANYAIAGLVFVQLVSNQKPNALVLVLGVVIYFLVWRLSLKILEEVSAK